jgi:hypothetical protein
MYRNKNKPRLSPHDTKFWNYAANLKRDGHRTIIHALAWKSPEAYAYLYSLLRDKTPLERISILLWRDHWQAARKLEKLGYGTLSPSCLRTFREKYFKTGNLPNPVLTKSKMDSDAQLAYQHGTQLKQMNESLHQIEVRVYPTKIGQKLRQKAFDSFFLAAKLQSRLSK